MISPSHIFQSIRVQSTCFTLVLWLLWFGVAVVFGFLMGEVVYGNFSLPEVSLTLDLPLETPLAVCFRSALTCVGTEIYFARLSTFGACLLFWLSDSFSLSLCPLGRNLRSKCSEWNQGEGVLPKVPRPPPTSSTIVPSRGIKLGLIYVD